MWKGRERGGEGLLGGSGEERPATAVRVALAALKERRPLGLGCPGSPGPDGRQSAGQWAASRRGGARGVGRGGCGCKVREPGASTPLVRC